MTAKTKAIPAGFEGVTPYLIIDGASAAIDFYKKAFGASEVLRIPGPGGKIGHAEIKIGRAVVMLADEHPDMGHRSPTTYKGTPVSLLFYVDDVDATFKRAVAAGGKVQRDVADQFYGDRAGTLVDPFGHLWTIATHVEDVPPDELQKRAKAMYSQ